MELHMDMIEVNGRKYVAADTIKEAPKVDASYVIVRSRDQGVMCGYLEKIEGRQVTLREARQLWSWDGKALCLPDISLHGIRGTARMSAATPVVIFLEACGVLPCTEAAAKSLISQPLDRHSA